MANNPESKAIKFRIEQECAEGLAENDEEGYRRL